MKPFTVIGLGNPGEKYANTYHNVGMLAVEFLTKKIQETHPLKKQRIYSSFTAALFPGLVLVTPNSFMNESGKVVREALKKTGSDPESLILVHDDSDLNLGEVRWSTGSGAAGHHGAESVIQTLGTKEFLRIRIGIRPATDTHTIHQQRKKASDIVLKHITKKDVEALQSVFEKTARKLIAKVYP